MVQQILLVEDNPDDEALALRALKKGGFADELVVARDGVEALDFLLDKNKDRDDLPALVLLDINLPRLNGLEVLKQLRQNAMTQVLPVVMLTSSKEDDDVSSSYEYGCNSYIRKPVDFKKFSEMITLVERYWLRLNEVPTNAG
ncbi:response regulator receiver protein [hydrothermal vent metagenome]|uniref:Response regulator receiver protein n=1 Tax=hydrothermal vent metagenome TaxID=652676 RepID=A0A3B1AZB5_9ZZZZ